MKALKDYELAALLLTADGVGKERKRLALMEIIMRREKAIKEKLTERTVRLYLEETGKRMSEQISKELMDNAREILFPTEKPNTTPNENSHV